jgi:hypothetical protein
MRAEEKINKTQKRQILSFFPKLPTELLTDEQWLEMWNLVEPQIKLNKRDWYGRNVAYKNRILANIQSVYRANYKVVSEEVEYCRAKNVERRELSNKLGIELPPEFPNPVKSGYLRAQTRLHEELSEEWDKRRRLWKHIAEGRLRKSANDLSRVSSMEVCSD